MPRSKSQRLRILSHFIAGYMLLALVWWTVLLLQRNREIYETNEQLIRIQGKDLSPPILAQSLVQNQADFRRQRVMIIGEGVVFVLALFGGIWFINRGYSRELDAIRQKRNFLLSITHELKSPLASIRLTLETFFKHNLSRSDATNLSQNAIVEVDRLTGLIDNLLLAVKLDKSYQPEFQEVDILQVIKDVGRDLESRFGEVSIALSTVADEIRAWVDFQGLYSIVYNICENAVKYGGKENHINIGVEMSEELITITISDMGPGISDVYKEKIFEQFFRIGNEDTRQSTGTGLGLYIVKRMVELHGGEISVLNNEPQGATFVLHLPNLRSNANLTG